MADLQIGGLGVALVTPFKDDEAIDYEALEKLVNHVIDGGVDYLVALGTTAETPTLTPDEKRAVVDAIVKFNKGRVPIVLGIGGNSTRRVVDSINKFSLEGISAILSVVPFYNKPSQNGLIAHFSYIAQNSPLPIILYNIPSRTGVNMTPETTLTLARNHKNIIAVKEASGDMVQIKEIINNKPSHFKVLSGDDGLTFKAMEDGAEGVISVAANIFPAKIKELVNLCLNKDYEKAEVLDTELKEWFELMFVNGNPAGIKCILNKAGMIKNLLRLPLVPVNKDTEKKIGIKFDSLK